MAFHGGCTEFPPPASSIGGVEGWQYFNPTVHMAGQTESQLRGEWESLGGWQYISDSLEVSGKGGHR